MVDFIYCNCIMGSELQFTTYTLPLSLSIADTVDQITQERKSGIPVDELLRAEKNLTKRSN